MPNLAAWNRRSPSHTSAVCCRPEPAGHVVDQPFVEEGDCLGLRSPVVEHSCGIGKDDGLGVLHQPVVLGMEHVVDGGQADIFVGAAVAGDEVRVEQFVVILPVGRRVVGIAQTDFDVAIGKARRHSVVGDVGKEGVSGADGAS